MPANVHDPAIASWIARGYTREQAMHQVAMEQQRRQAMIPATSPSHQQGSMPAHVSLLTYLFNTFLINLVFFSK